MGGKTWQAEEEEFFWRVIVPESPEGLNPSERKYSWKQCAEIMQVQLGHLRFRSYNKQLLYEHFYQNCKSERPSPRAKLFVREYLASRGPIPIERTRVISRDGQSARSRVSASRSSASSALTSEGRTDPLWSEQIRVSEPHETSNEAHHHAHAVSPQISCSVPTGEYNNTAFYQDEGFVRQHAVVSSGRVPLPIAPGHRGTPRHFPKDVQQTQASFAAMRSASPPEFFVNGQHRDQILVAEGESYRAFMYGQPSVHPMAQSHVHSPAPVQWQALEGDFGIAMSQNSAYFPQSTAAQSLDRSSPVSREHGPLFEALLAVTSVSSKGTPTDTSSDGRTKSISSTSTAPDGTDRGSSASGADKPNA